MSNHASILNSTSAQLIADEHWGELTDLYVAAKGTATAIALYDGTATTDSLLILQKVPAGGSIAVTNMKIQFNSHGVYALVDTNTEALTVHGMWTKNPVTVVLSGG